MSEGVQATPKQRSPWFYVFLGCAGVLLLMGLGVAALGFGVFRFAKGTMAGLTDPEVQKEATGALLGQVPEGYTAVFSLSVPVLLDAAAMAKLPEGQTLSPESRPTLEQAERFFLYTRMTQNDGTKGLKGFFEGEGDPKDFGRSLNFEIRETLGRGTLNLEGRKVLFLNARGTLKQVTRVRVGDGQDEPEEPTPRGGSIAGLAALVFFDCPADGKVRTGVWMQKDPSPESAGDKLETAGTVADAAQLKAFLGPLTPCGR